MSCNTDTGTRSTPRRNATRIDQNAQFHRRTTPTASNPTKPEDPQGNRRRAPVPRQVEGLIIDIGAVTRIVSRLTQVWN